MWLALGQHESAPYIRQDITHALESCPVLLEDTCSMLRCAFVIVVILVLLVRMAGSCVGDQMGDNRTSASEQRAASPLTFRRSCLVCAMVDE